MKIKAIIFDLDGTLCDYGVSVEEALEKAVTAHSPRLWSQAKEIFTKKDYSRLYGKVYKSQQETKDPGNGTRLEAFKLLLQEAGNSDEKLAKLIGKTYADLRVHSLYLFKEADEVLRKVSSKFSTGLLTNGPSDVQWEKIKELKLEGRFDQIMVSGDLGVAKPSREIFDKMLSKLNCLPQSALYVGDSQYYDVQGAKDSGLISVWLNKDHQEPKTEFAKPDYEIGDLGDLLKVIGLRP